MTTSAPAPFVPEDIEATVWEQIEPYTRALLERPIGNVGELERWLLDRGDLYAAIGEARANLYIAMTCDTGNQEANDDYAAFVENVLPKLEAVGFELDKRYVELAERHELDEARYAVLDRSTKSSVRLFREENIPIKTELTKLAQQHAQVVGSMLVEFEGEEKTVPQMHAYLDRTDRSIRESAWRAISDRRLQDRDQLNDLLTEMVAKRHQVACNAGYDNYIDYAFESKQRFDYTPADCERFWDACEKHVVPLKRELDAKRAKTLDVDSLRPWDLNVDEQGRDGLRPFNGGRELVDRSLATFQRLDSRLHEMFSGLAEGHASGDATVRTEYLDLDSRKGKRPGGYQYDRPRSRRPFIFMNAAGLHRDLVTMIHEAGHAFHSMLSAHEPLIEYRDYPIEFAEVASMAMEHLTRPHWGTGGFYTTPDDLARAQREHLTDAVTLLAWVATIDAFQHWMYRNPDHTAEQRDDYWLEVDDRFGHALDWSDLEDHRRSIWMKQTHVFSHPLYYIEYGIAELGALQLWLRSLAEGETVAVDAYISALSLGGSRPLPHLFDAAGIRFDFGVETVGAIVEAVQRELERLPG